jgi:O-antigen ligase
LAVVQQSHHERRGTIVFLLLSGVLSCGLGLWQVASVAISDDGGSASVASTDASGFFVNRNHLASFLAVSIVLASVFALDAIKSLTADPERIREPMLLITIGAATLAILIFLGTTILARSRAGIGLVMIAVVAALVLARKDPRRSSGRKAFGLAIVGIVAILLPASQFALYRVMERFGEDPLSDGRAEIAPVVWSAVQILLPFGSGLGTFVPVYKEVEEPTRALMGVYVNRAHNDYLESMMELGLPALILMVVFAVWLVRRLIDVWQRQDAGTPIDSMLARAASIVILILLAHSVVDFPLRTATLGCVFAVACALLIQPRPHTGGGKYSRQDEAVSQVQGPAIPKGSDAAKRTIVFAPESIPQPVSSVQPREANSTAKSYNLDRGRWPDAWQPGNNASESAAESAAAVRPDEPIQNPPLPDSRKRDLKDVLQDQKAWPKEWIPKDKTDAET